MIPCKLFLQKVQVFPENISKPKVLLNLNSIFYSEIKPFQTKYFCLTAHDIITVETVYEQLDDLIGSVHISSPYRLAIEDQTITLVIENHNEAVPLKKVSLIFSLATTSSYNKKKLEGKTPRTKHGNNIPEMIEEEKSLQESPRMEISFSNRSPLRQTNQANNFSPLFPGSISLEDSLFQPEEGESLESLAQQRQKILGELFGRFKKDK